MTANPIDAELEAWLVGNIGEGELLGEGYQATVRRLSSPAGELVVKSPHAGSLLAPLGRLSIRREHRIYERLGGIPGIPRSFGLAAGEHLVLEYVAGPRLRAHRLDPDDREPFYEHLLRTILAMHAAGVAHGDLKRKDNIVVGEDGLPYIIDFGIARMRGGAASWRDRVLFDVVRQMDLNAWIKLKHGRRPVNLPAADAEIYRPLKIERIARWLRIPWQKLTLRRPRQRWRRRREDRERRS